MTREKKRKLSILASIVGIVLLVIVVVTSEEFKEKLKKDEELENVTEIVISKDQGQAINLYENYTDGIERVVSGNTWQKKIADEVATNYEVWGDEEGDGYSIVYGAVNVKEEVEGKGETYENTRIYPWIAMYDTEGNKKWIFAEDTEYNSEWITEVTISKDFITVFTTSDDDSQLDDRKIILSRYSLDGERINYVETDIWGEVEVSLVDGEDIYGFIDKKVTHNNAVYTFNLDGTTEEIYECASEELLERGAVVDMAIRGEKLYFSTYLYPVSDYNKGQYEMDESLFFADEETILIQNDEGEYQQYFSSKMLSKLKKHYTAALIEYNSETGKCTEIERVKSSIGSGVSVNENNEIVWEVEKIFTAMNYSTFYMVANTNVTNKYYDSDNQFIKDEKLDEIRVFSRSHSYD